MKHLIKFIAVALFVIFSGNIEAADVGSPADTNGKGEFSLNAENTYIFDRDLQDAALNSGHISGSEQARLKLQYGVADNIDVYGKLGAADMKTELNLSNGNEFRLEYDYGLSWGLGTKAQYALTKDYKLGLDVQYLTWGGDLDSLSRNSISATSRDGSSDVQEFQTVFLASRAVEITPKKGEPFTLIPYVGAKYSNILMGHNAITYTLPAGSGTLDSDVDAEDNFGILLGVGAKLKKSLSFNVEGRFIDETAASGGFDYKF